MKYLRALLVCTASAATVIGCGGGAPESTNSDPDATPQAEAGLPASAIAQMKALVEEKAARTPAQRKIGSQLLYAKAGRFAAAKPASQKVGGETAPSAPTEILNLLQVDDQGRVLVDIKGDVDAGLERQIETLNGKVVYSSLPHRSARAWLPLASLEPLAEQPIVQVIRPALMAKTNRVSAAKFMAGPRAERLGKVRDVLEQSLLRAASSDARAEGGSTNVGAATSEGSAAHAADRARKFFNTDGTGVRIGVLSDSDDFKEASIASGDLPADTVTVPGQSGRPGSGEGTAMMEIVHDVAPGAKLFFATAFESPESFADNIRRLRFEFGCDIIIDDVIYFFESPYQDDIIAAAVIDVTEDGALYFSSAGNEGNYNDGTSGTWEGDFKAAGTLPSLPAGYTINDFSGGDKVISNRIEFGGGPLILHWSDPGSLDNAVSSNDYDLFVLDDTLRNVVLAATDIQDGDDLPFEFLGFFIPADFRVVVARNVGAATRAVRIVHFGGEFGLSTPGAVYGHAAAFDAVAVAAVDAALAVGGEFIAGPTTPVELFSADGYRRVFYNRNGVRIHGGVTFNSVGGELRFKPEVAAADGVSTTLPPSSGLNPFFGTSAAAPHAGAIAGLLMSAMPENDRFRNRQAIIDGTLDIEAAGHDRDSGTGIVSAMKALQQGGARPAVFLDLGTVVTTPTGSDAVIPGGGGQISVQLVNNGGLQARNIAATLTSSSLGVTITQGGSAYPNIVAGAGAANVTPFAFTLSPAALCGARLDFALRVTFTGLGTSPSTFNFGVQTGRAGAPTTFSFTGPPVLIPDDDPVGVDVPLAVSGIGSLASLVFSIDGTACSNAIGATTVGVDHTFVGDLIFRLTSPAGTDVSIINFAGGPFNSGNNFCQTVLQDGAPNSIQNVLSTQAPFTGTFSPASPLSTFTSENADGTWVLNVSDNAFIDIGRVRAFSLRASGFSCAP